MKSMRNSRPAGEKASLEASSNAITCARPKRARVHTVTRATIAPPTTALPPRLPPPRHHHATTAPHHRTTPPAPQPTATVATVAERHARARSSTAAALAPASRRPPTWSLPGGTWTRPPTCAGTRSVAA
eukprot:997084-Prymnesium_polylepis.1